MVTLFSSMRPFVEPHTTLIQRNAIQSWLALRPQPQIILMGDDAGVAEIAREFSAMHVRDVEKNAFGMPMRSSMCRIAHSVADHDLLCIINSDIIVLDHFRDALSLIPLERFVAAGRRHDLDVEESINTESEEWRSGLRERMRNEGALRSPSTLDYIIYSKSITPPVLPPFPMNSFGWDPWFLYAHRRRGIPIVNVMETIDIIHQNHQAREDERRRWKAWGKDAQAMAELRAAGGFSSMMTLREADYVLTREGLVRPPRNRVLSRLVTTFPYRKALGLKRWTEFCVLP